MVSVIERLPDTSLFNALGHISKYNLESAKGMEPKAYELCQIINDLNLNKLVAVTLLHNHFPLSDDKCIVLYRTTENNALYASRTEPVSSELLPVQFALKLVDETIKAVPILFTRAEDFPEVPELLKTLEDNAARLLPALVKRTEEIGLPPTSLGIFLRIFSACDSNTMLVEETDEIAKTQVYKMAKLVPVVEAGVVVFKPVDFSEDSILPVIWLSDSGPTADGGCYMSCCCKCND